MIKAQGHSDLQASEETRQGGRTNFIAAEFDDFDCRGVPSRLVRRNPEKQMMLIRERVLAHKDAIGAGGDYWRDLIKLFLDDSLGFASPTGDAIYIVPRKPPDGFDRPSLIAGISALRKAGVAEPD